MTELQIETCNAVVSLFETGRLPSPEAYGTCAILADGAGISYGKHQATARSGSLWEVLSNYRIRGGYYAEEIVATIGQHSLAESTWPDPPGWVADLCAVLRKAGSDLRMHEAQDEVFRRDYWEPAAAQARETGVVSALGHLALYDLAIHSGTGRLAALRSTFREMPPLKGGDEREWVWALLRARRRWLGSSANPVIAKTVYRVVALEELADRGRWDLARPLTVRGVTIR